MAKHYVRFQPPGLGLKHTSEGSSTALPRGFVFAYNNLDEPLWGEWTPFSPGWRRKDLVVLTFTGSDEYDPGDAEGCAVRPGRLLHRESMINWLRRIGRTAKYSEHRRVARELLDG